MKVICTIDYVDGSKSRSSNPMDIERVGSFLLLTLSERSIAGITITRVHSLAKLAELLSERPR